MGKGLSQWTCSEVAGGGGGGNLYCSCLHSKMRTGMYEVELMVTGGTFVKCNYKHKP